MSKGVGEAPGKILLIGEHSVVYGHPAIAMPVEGARARVEVDLTRDGRIEIEAPDIAQRAVEGQPTPARLAPLQRLAGSVRELFGEPGVGLRVCVRSSIPVGRGMGSGAAVAVALVRAICAALDRKLADDQVEELAMEAEREFHGAPSGVDVAVTARRQAVYFVRGRTPQPIVAGDSVFRFVIADTGIEAPTMTVVEEVRLARERDQARLDALFWELGSMASVAREIIRCGAPAEMGVCLSHAHALLKEVGVSSPELDALVQAAMTAGALGAKLSGAGRGGVMIALVEDAGAEERMIAALRDAGAVGVFSAALSR
jgi:mevalonate kinase